MLSVFQKGGSAYRFPAQNPAQASGVVSAKLRGEHHTLWGSHTWGVELSGFWHPFHTLKKKLVPTSWSSDGDDHLKLFPRGTEGTVLFHQNFSLQRKASVSRPGPSEPHPSITPPTSHFSVAPSRVFLAEWLLHHQWVAGLVMVPFLISSLRPVLTTLPSEVESYSSASTINEDEAVKKKILCDFCANRNQQARFQPHPWECCPGHLFPAFLEWSLSDSFSRKFLLTTQLSAQSHWPNWPMIWFTDISQACLPNNPALRPSRALSRGMGSRLPMCFCACGADVCS